LTNVVRHARASSVRIASRAPDVAGSQHVIIEIEDDGIGFAPDGCRSGNGLNHLRSRARQLGAAVSIISGQGKGTKITLTLPSVFATTS
jgi:signal transduction histidine kinase